MIGQFIIFVRKHSSQAIRKDELAWILLNFNQKAWLLSVAWKEDDTNSAKCEEYYELKVISVEADEEGKVVNMV